MINTIIFDFFAVICSEIAPFWFARYFAPGKAPKLKDEYFHPFDLDQISEDELFTQMAKLIKSDAQSVKKEIDELVIIDERMVNLIKKLKTKYKIGLLSNGNSIFVRRILKTHKLENLFDDIVISGEQGITKPNPKIYKNALKNLNAKAANTIFIDDSENNISGAKKIGIKTILFKNYDEFIIDLNKLIS